MDNQDIFAPKIKYGRGKHPNSRKSSPFIKGHKIGVGKKYALGFKHSIETRTKLSLIQKGKNTWMKGRKLPQEWCDNIGKAKLGVRPTIETRKKQSEAYKGSKSYMWRGGLTSKNKMIRKSLEYRLWREAVFTRDNWSCVECGTRGGELNADHIKPFASYPELRFALDNGRTLCVQCHRKTPTWGPNLITEQKEI